MAKELGDVDPTMEAIKLMEDLFSDANKSLWTLSVPANATHTDKAASTSACTLSRLAAPSSGKAYDVLPITALTSENSVLLVHQPLTVGKALLDFVGGRTGLLHNTSFWTVFFQLPYH